MTNTFKQICYVLSGPVHETIDTSAFILITFLPGFFLQDDSNFDFYKQNTETKKPSVSQVRLSYDYENIAVSCQNEHFFQPFRGHTARAHCSGHGYLTADKFSPYNAYCFVVFFSATRTSNYIRFT
jgi:hypothetical protein